MKCPKCNYLGFETGDRCKNCGYDFSLMMHDGADEPFDIDIDLRAPGFENSSTVVPDPVVREPEPLEATPPLPPAPTPISARLPREPKLPVIPAFDEDDAPLVRLPVTPRPPLAVRRTPDTPRLRAITQVARHVEPEPVLRFEQEASQPEIVTPPRPASGVWAEPGDRRLESSGSGPRLAAALIDLVMLGGIDIAVVYFTLRMAGLSMGDWATLPPVPLIAFLLLVKFSYFCAFTAVGGQTIGKMAAHIRVVSADEQPIDGALALRRTLAGAASAGLLGLGFLPVLLASDRRALHDRLARTRVVALPSA